MKMISLTFIFCLFFSTLTAPPVKELPIAEGKGIFFDPMLIAFMQVESNFDTDTINRLGYGGILQIGSEMVEEANRISRIKGINQSFTLTDRLDSTKSVQMWYIVQNYWNESYALKRACIVWNPLASINYYRKIKKLI